MNDHGFRVAAFNRTISKVKDFQENEAKGTAVCCFFDVPSFMESLKSPKRVMLMVKAGPPVDDFIRLVKPHMTEGDIIIDGGNSLYTDTERRCKELEAEGLCFVGCGVSGGEEGARFGPSMMPGGTASAWPFLQPIFQGIAAKVVLKDASSGKEELISCCQWIGAGGAGHFVKMVHNGIEYADMQALCDGYQILRAGLRMDSAQCSAVLKAWRATELDGFLLEIGEAILAYKDDDGDFLVDKIRDVAGQKGTGKWTVMAALDTGVVGSLFSEAVFFRSLSALKGDRVKANQVFSGPSSSKSVWEDSMSSVHEDLRKALYCAKIMAYAQGFSLIQSASRMHSWDLNFSGICHTWMGGCIIRSKLLERIYEAFRANDNSETDSFLFHPYFVAILESHQVAWRSIICKAVQSGVAVGALSTSLSFYDSFRTDMSSANLLQAMRDFFGAHTYELQASPGTWHHTNWTGRGGQVASTVYQS